MPERRDYLSVCNDQGIPLPDFQATFCVRCVQPECSRSRAGGLFETRVTTWEERLFKNPPRMPKDDPLYAMITAKRFIEIDTGRIPEVNGRLEWVDPRGLEEPKEPSAKPRPVRKPKPPDSTPRVEESTPRVGPPEARRAPLNSDFEQGALLIDPRVTAPVSRKPVDPWGGVATAPAASVKPDVPVVKAGAVIKFK